MPDTSFALDGETIVWLADDLYYASRCYQFDFIMHVKASHGMLSPLSIESAFIAFLFVFSNRRGASTRFVTFYSILTRHAILSNSIILYIFFLFSPGIRIDPSFIFYAVSEGLRILLLVTF